MTKHLPNWFSKAIFLLTIMFALPHSALADTIYYLDDKGDVQSCDATQIDDKSSGSGTYTLSDSYYFVSGTRDVLTPIEVSGNVHLILLDDATLNAQGCIIVEGTNSLTITSGSQTSTIAGTGKLTVTDLYNGDGSGDNDNAGDDARIGSQEGNTCGTITINGGKVEAYSTYSSNSGTGVYGADLGSGHGGNGGTININGGIVHAYGAWYKDEKKMSGAAIGSGYEAGSTPVNININGGYVDAVCTSNYTSYGAGIGTGEDAEGAANINITGGTVWAYSSSNYAAYGAGIGTGQSYSSSNNTEINISGGTVTAFSSHNGADEYGYGAGIGMGEGWSSSNGKVNITITGGTVKGVSGYWCGYGSGIGGGQDGGCGTITISCDANVTGFNCETANSPKASGIGDGESPVGGSLTINGDRCTVDTWGLYGIGDKDNKFTAKAVPTSIGTVKIAGSESEYGSGETTSYSTGESVTITYNSQQWRNVSFDYGVSVYYTDENGKVAGPVKAVEVTESLPSTLGDGGKSAYYYYVSQSISQSTRPTVKGNVVLILADGVDVNCTGGINVEGSNSLTITAGGTSQDFEGTGSLTAQGGKYQAGIGGGDGGSDGTVTINGGTVTATGGYCAAGIGGGYGGSGGTVTINGGTVTTNGETNGAGIGGGNGGSGGTVTINGGTVTAIGGGLGAGIGGGNTGSGGTVTINEGTVTATGGLYGAGIGGGSNGSGGTVTINGGTVSATGGNNGSAIGGGYSGSAGKLAISGNADVTVQSNEGGIYALFCSTATATPDEGYAVLVQDNNKNNIDGTPSTSQVDLNAIGLGNTYQYAHIFMQKGYVVTYDANGGSGTMQSVATDTDGTTVISDNTFTNDDQIFAGWNTSADGSGTWYDEGATTTFDSNTTLYAIWTDSPAYYYINLSGNTAAASSQRYTVVSESTETLTSGHWIVNSSVTLSKRLYVNTNDVTLILLDDATLDASSGGIEVLDGGTLTITVGNTTEDIAGTGSLIAKGAEKQAGIGGDNGGSCGTINIIGGTVTATSGDYAAGIGGGFQGAGGIVNILGGTVSATGNNASAIGGGNSGSSGTLVISGNADVTVQTPTDGVKALYCTTATATPDEGYSVIVQDNENNYIEGTPSASQVDLNAIGLGSTYQYAHIFIKKVYVVTYDANGGNGTMQSVATDTDGTTVISVNTFTNGDLTFAGWNTKSDGSGTWYDEGETTAFTSNVTLYAIWTDDFYYYLTSEGETATVASPRCSTISESTEILTSGIWIVNSSVTLSKRLNVNANNVTLVLLDGATIDATSGGILVTGGDMITITVGNTDENISGTGSLIAKGDDFQPGIGGGGTVNILGGTINATGDSYAAGIGGAYHGSGGTVNILGGTINAIGGSYAAGIGGGDSGTGGTLVISGNADVTAQGCYDYALFCTTATATPDEGYAVIVQDINKDNFEGTPSTSQVDLNAIGLDGNYVYAHIFMGTDYTVTYDVNGGSGTMEQVNADAGETVVISENTFTNSDLTFAGWNTKNDGTGKWYDEGENVVFKSDVTLYAIWTDVFYYYLTAEGETATIASPRCSVITESTDTLTSGIWVVKDNINANSRIYVSTNDVTLILLDDAKLDASNGGIEVTDGGTLTITVGNTTEDIAGTGSLIAKGAEKQTGIGGGFQGAGGTVNILGGTVSATGGDYASAIGGGNGGSGGTLVIRGNADVTVQSSSDGVYALNCSIATATPGEYGNVYVQEKDGNDIEGTPSTSQVDLNSIGLGSTYQYAHIFFKYDLIKSSVSSLAFDNVTVASSSEQTFTVTYDGDGTLSAATDNNDYTTEITGPNDDGTYTVKVTFKPSAMGKSTATLTISDDNASVTVSLSGTGTGRSFTLHVSEANIATMYLDFPVEIPYDQNLHSVMYAYKVSGKNLCTYGLKKYIPASEFGVLVFTGKEMDVTFNEVTAETATEEIYSPENLGCENMLRGVLETTDVSDLEEDGSTIYTLGYGTSSIIGFYKYTGTSIRANSCYLPFDNSTSAGINALNIVIDNDDDATGIINAESLGNADDNDGWYSLQGIKLNGKPEHPGVYIHGNRKVLVK